MCARVHGSACVSVCLSVFVDVCTHACMLQCVTVYACECAHAPICGHVCDCVCAHARACFSVRLCACVHMRVHASMCVLVCACECVCGFLCLPLRRGPRQWPYPRPGSRAPSGRTKHMGSWDAEAKATNQASCSGSAQMRAGGALPAQEQPRGPRSAWQPQMAALGLGLVQGRPSPDLQPVPGSASAWRPSQTELPPRSACRVAAAAGKLLLPNGARRPGPSVCVSMAQRREGVCSLPLRGHGF